MHLQSEKVTSTCSQRFAELDPDSSHMLLAAPERFRDDADACRLSMDHVSSFQRESCTVLVEMMHGVLVSQRVNGMVRIHHWRKAVARAIISSSISRPPAHARSPHKG